MNLILKELIRKNNFNMSSLIKKIDQISNIGIKKIVIAPCYYDEESKTSIEEVEKIVQDLNLYMKQNNKDVVLYYGNLLRDNYDNIKELISGKIGSINNSKYVLLNTEESTSLRELLEVVYELTLRDYVPIIVAPERIGKIINNYKNINKLAIEGCLFQLDLASINGEYGKEILKTAKTLKRKGVYSFVGIDEEVKIRYINKYIESLSNNGTSIFIKNEELTYKSIIKNKKVGILK